jgi:uncharacterized repeat protein (TIGR03803 family)
MRAGFSIHALWRRSALGVFLVVMPFAPAAAGHHYKVLYSFCSIAQCADGAHPGGLIVGKTGDLYGITYPGGANNWGTVFALGPVSKGDTSETVLYSFCSAENCADGAAPMGPLIRDRSGNLYGVTNEGGAHGAGEAFELVDKRGGRKLKILYSFCSRKDCADGKLPRAGLTYAGAQSGTPYDGSSPLFGTTSDGGAGSRGVAYALQQGRHGWTEKVLYSFCATRSCGDGAVPMAPLTADNAGNLYGTTWQGGANEKGTVFELERQVGAWAETVLYSFCALANCEDGAVPFGGLAMNGSGTLFGFANEGGITCVDTDHGPCGVVYSIVPNGTASQYTVLYTFGAGGRADDGANPSGTPLLDAQGNLLGTTMFGGTGFFGGVAFELSGARLRVLHTFCAMQGDGCQPNGLVQDRAGRLFGATDAGGSGTDSNGTVFRLTP